MLGLVDSNNIKASGELISPNNPCYDHSLWGSFTHMVGGSTKSETSCLENQIPTAPTYGSGEDTSPWNTGLYQTGIDYWNSTGPFNQTGDPNNNASSTFTDFLLGTRNLTNTPTLGNWFLLGAVLVGLIAFGEVQNVFRR